MRRLKIVTAAILSASVFASTAQAAALCTTGKEMAALRAAAIQQQLMVAGLTCQAGADYNRFVLAYRPELRKSDADLKAYFVRRHGRRRGEEMYDSFKTKLANLSSFSQVTNVATYCAKTHAAFDEAFNSRESLDRFVAKQPLLIALPEQRLCAAKPGRMEAAKAPSGRRYSER